MCPHVRAHPNMWSIHKWAHKVMVVPHALWASPIFFNVLDKIIKSSTYRGPDFEATSLVANRDFPHSRKLSVHDILLKMVRNAIPTLTLHPLCNSSLLQPQLLFYISPLILQLGARGRACLDPYGIQEPLHPNCRFPPWPPMDPPQVGNNGT